MKKMGTMEMGTRKQMPALRAISMVIWKVSKIAMSQTIFDGSKTAMGTRTMSLTLGVVKVSQGCVSTWSFFDNAAHVLRSAHTTV